MSKKGSVSKKLTALAAGMLLETAVNNPVNQSVTVPNPGRLVPLEQQMAAVNKVAHKPKNEPRRVVESPIVGASVMFANEEDLLNKVINDFENAFAMAREYLEITDDNSPEMLDPQKWTSFMVRNAMDVIVRLNNAYEKVLDEKIELPDEIKQKYVDIRGRLYAKIKTADQHLDEVTNAKNNPEIKQER